MKCLNCGIEFEGRKDAKFCSPKCRVTFSRKQSVVTDNVTVNEIDVTDNFKFKTPNKRTESGFHEDDNDKIIIRQSKYWYDVPIAAIPIIQKGWPQMPDDLNGRQYFLWWKNEFKIQGDRSKPGFGLPEIHNPFPFYDKLTYYNAAEGSRRWGA